jgi:hypothetical protein
MSMKEHINYAITKLSFSFSSSRVTPYGGLLIPGQMLSAIDFDRKVDRHTPPSKEYSNSDILKSMLIGILCGNADFGAIHETDDDPEYFCNTFHMKHLPSEATMRQRMDEIGDSLRDTLRMANVSLFKEYGIEPSALANGYVPVDIDVSPFIDEKCSKEGVSRTYKCKDGYAPIFAYIGTEGYLLACELREGKQHCQKDTPAFLTEVLRLARLVTGRPLLFRLDSGNDSADNIGLFMEECLQGDNVHFIIKRNLRKEKPQEWLDKIRDVCTNIQEPRKGKKEYIGQTFGDISYYIPDSTSKSGQKQKTVGIRTIYDITECACDHDGQYYVFPKVECDMYFVNVDFRDEDIIKLYHKHGEMEQYHSEIKTDLGAEQFPSGKFRTNELILELIQLAYNMLRMIGQASLKMEDIPMKRPVKRRRLRTVLEHIIMTPAVVTKHARKTGVDLGRSNPWRNAVARLWERFHKAT